eukprot:g1842.t1
MKYAVPLLTLVLHIVSVHAISRRDGQRRQQQQLLRANGDEANPTDVAKGLATHAAVHAGGSTSFPIPRSTLPDGFGAKVAFQTVRSKNANGEDIVTERLIRCGIEKYPDGSDIYPCNPSFDTRPYIRGLDHVGTGFDALTGDRRAPLFEWSVPAWFKPAYDSGRYNYDYKIPEQITLTGVPRGEGGMVTELFQNYNEYETKSSFATNIGFGAFGADIGFSLSKSSTRFRSAFDNFEIGISKQKYELYQLSVKQDIYGTCPYNEPVFAAEEGKVNTADGRESPSDGQVAEWKVEETAKWARDVKLPEDFANKLEENGIEGPLLLTLEEAELTELGLDTTFKRHKFRFELDKARKKETEEAVASDVGGGPTDTGVVAVDLGDVEQSAGTSVNGSSVDPISETEMSDATTNTGTDPPPPPPPLSEDSEEAEQTTLGLDYAHPRYLRKYVMRQAFIDAVNALPVFSERQINHICPYFDSERSREEEEAAEMALWSDTDISADMVAEQQPGKLSKGTQYPDVANDPDGILKRREELTPASADAILRYRRFLYEWGTHWASAVTMGGEVEVTTMVRKSTQESRSEDVLSTETNIEAKEKSVEEENDKETSSSTTVDSTSKLTGEEASEDLGAQPSSSTHTVMQKDSSSGGAGLAALRGVLTSLADGGASTLIKEAIQNLQLKMNIKTESSKREKNVLTNENNKNEIRFVGGDTAVDPDSIGGAQFAAWKDTIKENPAPVQKTLSPITELVLAFAGPNAGEQCPESDVHARIGRVAQMLECMTKLLLREGRDLSDTVYELSQIERKKAIMDQKVTALANCADSDACQVEKKKATMEWQSLCAIRLTLLSKRDRQHAKLFSFTHKFPEDSPTAAKNYNKLCERELASLTAGQQTKIISSVTRLDSKTGREVTDKCALCMAVYENAKCLATRKECGPRNAEIPFDTKENRDMLIELISEGTCELNEGYNAAGSDRDASGALPGMVKSWLAMTKKKGRERLNALKKWNSQKAKFAGGTGWMGWSAILFAPSEVLCDKTSNTIVCQSFVKALRQDLCRSPADETAVHMRRSALIAALDFGSKGENVDATTARSSCECSGYCVPEIDTKKGWQLHFESSTSRGWAGIVISNIFHKEAMRVQYEESLIRDELETCVARKPQPTPMLAAGLTECEKQRPWMKPNAGPKISCDSNAVLDVLTSYFTSTVAYIGHCKPGSFCFSFDALNQGDQSKAQLYKEGPPNDKGTPTLALTDIDLADPDVAERRGNKFGVGALGDVVNFRAWGESTNKPWTHRGIVYAELIVGSKGLPKLVVVQSGLAKNNHPNFFVQFARDFMNTLKGTLDLAGPNLNDPRRVVILEDRAGNNIGGRDAEGIAHGACAWLYHICCAIGGTMHTDPESPNHGALSKQCPRGTVCCPPEEKDDAVRSAPWTQNTIDLLWTLSHGRLKGAPRMGMDDTRQGWQTQDPISGTGPSKCWGGSPKKIREAFADHAAVADSRQARKEQSEREQSEISTCEFWCKEKTSMMGTSARCVKSNGAKLYVSVEGVPKGQCEKGGWFAGKDHKGKQTVKRAEEQCKGVNAKCGYAVDFKREIPIVETSL